MHHIRAATHPIGGRVRIQHRQALAGQHDRSRTLSLDGDPPGSCRFVGVGGTEHSEPGNGSEARQVLNRLMGRSVLADDDAVMREHEDDVGLHEGREANSGPKVIGEHEERGSVRQHTAVKCHPVDESPHGVLADAEMEVVAASIIEPEVAVPDQQRLGRGTQIRRPAGEGGVTLGDGVHDLSPSFASGHCPRIEPRDSGIPAVGELPRHGLVELRSYVGMLGSVPLQQLVPRGVVVRASIPHSGEMSSCCLRHVKGGLSGEPERLFGEPHAFGPQRLAVRSGRILLGTAETDVIPHHDKRRTVGI